MSRVDLLFRHPAKDLRMSRVDLLFLTHNRLEFTKLSVQHLLKNTDWNLVRSVLLYDDLSVDGTLEFMKTVGYPVIEHSFGSPVSVLGEAVIEVGRDAILAKIDNDALMPPGWLNESLALLDAHPELDLLGLEAMYRPLPGSIPRSIVAAPYIGGLALMRTRAFHSLPEPRGRFGFTAWQDQHPEVTKAWMSPSLPVCLLDRVPLEPWYSLSGAYVAKNWQRPWQPYGRESKALWEWWA